LLRLIAGKNGKLAGRGGMYEEASVFTKEELAKKAKNLRNLKYKNMF